MGTVAGLWEAAAAEERSFPAYLVREGERWRPVSWTQAGTAVDELAAGFLAFGIQKGDRVAIASRTRLEWTLVDLALASIGAVTVPVYPTSSALEVAYVLGSSGARALVVEDAEQDARLVPLRSELEALDLTVAIEGSPPASVSLEELRARGRSYADAHGDEVASRRRGIAGDDLLTLIYTSGTTGRPKGCMIAHRHYAAMVEMIRGVPGLFEGHDVVLLFLPLAHTFARLVQYAGAGVGYTVAYCAESADVPRALLEVRPTIFPSVPRLFEKVHAGVAAALAEASGPRRRLAEWALRTGREAAVARREGRRPGAALGARHALADRLVLAKLRTRLGGALRFAISGGAPLSPEVAEFFDAFGVTILEGYGLTECTTASHVNRPGRYRFGTVGLPLPGVEVRVAEDGEILLRGENVFAGYWGDERASAEVLAGGWLRTGDVGAVDQDGFLTITDRKKDLIVTAGGKNVSPQNLENALRSSRFVSQALVVGEGRPYVTALLTLDREELARAGLSDDGGRTLAAEAVAAANRDLGRVEQIKRFVVLDRDFLLEEGELTPTLKLRRRICEEHFRDEIERLYAEPSPPAAPGG